MILDTDFHHRYGPWAVVAGASEGIGRAYAHALAEKGIDVLMIARRSDVLEEEARIIRRRHRVNVETASMDLGAPDLAERFARLIDGKDVGLLVYNACYSKIAPYLESDLASKLATIDVNCRGPIVLTSSIGERLASAARGRSPRDPEPPPEEEPGDHVPVPAPRSHRDVAEVREAQDPHDHPLVPDRVENGAPRAHDRVPVLAPDEANPERGPPEGDQEEEMGQDGCSVHRKGIRLFHWNRECKPAITFSKPEEERIQPRRRATAGGSA